MENNENMQSMQNMERTDSKKPNQSIACSVCSCTFQDKTTYHCTLDKIKVGTHESNPTVSKCTDCESFVYDEKKSDSDSPISQ